MAFCNAWSYNTEAAIQATEALGVTGNVLQQIFADAAEFKRVHDKKVVILGLSALIATSHMQLPEVLATGMGQILALVLRLVNQCHEQKEKEAAEAAEEEEEEESEDEEEEEEDSDDDEAGGFGGAAESDEEEGTDDDAKYLAFLAAEEKKMVRARVADLPIIAAHSIAACNRRSGLLQMNLAMGEFDEDLDFLEEDDTVISSLDEVDEVKYLAGKLNELAAASGEAAAALTGSLDAEHSALLERVMTA